MINLNWRVGGAEFMQLAIVLRTTRQKSFFTQECFAKELGVTASTINRWEHGKAKPNLTAMKNLKLFCVKNNLNYKLIETAWFSAQNEK